MDQYEVQGQVGKGSFGQAFVVIHRETKAKCVPSPLCHPPCTQTAHGWFLRPRS
jgi:hypothetical protein